MSLLRSLQKGSCAKAVTAAVSSGGLLDRTEITPASLSSVKAYAYPTTINWYPGHQVKALRQLKEEFLPRAHMVLEIRDARIPLSSRNPQIEAAIEGRNRVIVFTKSDLLTHSQRKLLLKFIDRHYPNTDYILAKDSTENSRNCEDSKSVVSANSSNDSDENNDSADIQHSDMDSSTECRSSDSNDAFDEMNEEMDEYSSSDTAANKRRNAEIEAKLQSGDKYTPTFAKRARQMAVSTQAMLGDSRTHFVCRRVSAKLKQLAVRSAKWRSLPTVVAVMGYPNVGKSTLINSMRNLQRIRARAEVGNRAGITRNIMAFKICSNPLIHLLDTPGIFVPALRKEDTGDVDRGMRLAVCGCIRDASVGSIEMADYILHRMNASGNEQRYVEACGLQRHTHDIEQLLYAVAVANEFYYSHGKRTSLQTRDVDLQKAAELFVEWYRSGKLDRHMLDDLTPYVH